MRFIQVHDLDGFELLVNISKIIWLQRAYCGCVRWSDNWTTTEYRWHDRHEHLIWTLKGPYGR